MSKNVDALINLEARGVTGPANMFETSRPNGASLPCSPGGEAAVANSLSTDVYRLMPNYTDVNSFAERGWLTLNLAPIGNETRYHSAGDTIAALDPATLNHMGAQTLALATALANGTPQATAGDRIFMDVASRALIDLPLIAGVILLAVLLIAFAVLALRRGGLARGTLTIVGTMIGASLLAWLLLELIGLVRPACSGARTPCGRTSPSMQRRCLLARRFWQLSAAASTVRACGPSSGSSSSSSAA